MPITLPTFQPSRGGLLWLFAILSISLSAQLSVSVTGTDIECFALANGTATAAPANGTSPYTYAWSNGGTGQTIVNLNAGTYTVTVTDDDGATASGSVTLTEATQITATITDPVECEAPFVIAAQPQGGAGGYTYNWSTGAKTRSVSVPAGDYCVTIVDANRCGIVECKTVEENPPVVMVPNVELLCNGDEDGSLTANPGGGTPPYSYRWSTGAAGRTINGLSPGSYRVTLTDDRGCTATATGQVTEPPVLNVNVRVNGVNCDGQANVFLAARATGGTAPYFFAWNTGALSDGIGPLPAGTYTLTVTDANQCTDVATVTLEDADPVEVAITGDELLCGAGSTGTLTARPVSGPVSQYTYEWSNGAMGSTITDVGAGTYTVTATDGNGCEGTASATVEVIDLSLRLGSTPITCNGDDDGTATATVTGGDAPYTYLWSNGAATATITGLGGGTYTVTVTDANDCKASGRIVLNEPAALAITATINNPDCADNSNGAIDLSVSGGTTPYFYQWSNGEITQDIDGLTAGTYSVTVTDANGCTETLSRTLTSPPAVTVSTSVVDVDCFGASTGQVTATATGGTAPFTYRWSNNATTRVIRNLAAGTYTVTVTDANGCTGTGTDTVDQPTDFIVSTAATDADCTGASTGSINLTVSGATAPYTYRWSNNATTRNISNLAAGTYTVTITDANNCTETATETVGQPPAIGIRVVPTNVDCFGAATGSIDATVTGGTAPYTYVYSNGGGNQEDADGLPQGTYTLTVTDANGCTASTSVTIQQPTDITLSAEITPVACLGDATGMIDLSVAGGTPAYTYAWSTGENSQDISGLAAGDYTVTVTDANGCTDTETYTVGSNSAITITGTATPADCNDEASGSVDISVSGGTGSYAYSWSNGATTQDLDGVAAGIYTVSVTDNNECTATASFTITEPAAISVTTSAPTIQCGGTSSGSITVIASGGTAPYTYSLNGSPLTFTGTTVAGLVAGSYTITVTDANGCTALVSGIVVSELPLLTCEVEVDQQPTTGNNGQLTVDVDGGTQPYNYAWSNGETTQTIDELAAGTYSVTVTDANGCTTQCTGTLRPLAGIGDFVWLDENTDGQQDDGEPGIADFPVFLKDAGGIIIDSTRTDDDGLYAFMGLEPGTYSILFDAPDNAIITAFRQGDDTSDSDADPGMNGMTPPYTLAPGEFNMTVDAGYFTAPGGAIADPCNCLNNNTNDINGQFSEIIEVRADPGQTWTIVSRQNMFLLSSPAPPAAPIPVPLGTELTEVSPGVYQYEFKLVDEFVYSSVLTNGVFSLEISNQCFYPTVSFETLPPESLCRFEEPFELNGMGSIPGEVVFTVNGEEVTELDPMALPLGEYIIEGQLFPTDPEECLAIIRREIILVDDCDAKLGDFVFFDANANGIQDAGEDGIEGVKATVTSQDGSYTDMTTTDETGMYMFAVPPGTYKVTFEVSDEDLIVSPPNRGPDDALDSDVDPTTLMTPFYTLEPNEMNFTIDAGFYNPCIDNVTDPGTIGYDQEVCGPGNAPNTLVEVAPATGGIGEIEYLWMMNTDNPNQDIAYWSPIPNSNTPNYSPGPVSQTTYFTRCIRRANCPFKESNYLTVTVGNDAVASINGPSVLCVGEAATFSTGGSGGIKWTFSGAPSVETSNAGSVNMFWRTFGTFSVTLTVTRNGCTSTQVKRVSVIRNPNRCGDGLQASGQVNSLLQREVAIEWEAAQDGSDYMFEVQRSTNGRDFTSVAEVMEPSFVSGGMGRYHLEDVSPLAGRTMYRVISRSTEYGDLMSNIVELSLAPATTALGRVFPNPAREGMLHVEMTDMPTLERTATVQLFDARGNAVGNQVSSNPATGVINLPTEGRPAGIYFLRLNVGGEVEIHRVVID